jgi:hypothetical protein
MFATVVSGAVRGKPSAVIARDKREGFAQGAK